MSNKLKLLEQFMIDNKICFVVPAHKRAIAFIEHNDNWERTNTTYFDEEISLNPFEWSSDYNTLTPTNTDERNR